MNGTHDDDASASHYPTPTSPSITTYVHSHFLCIRSVHRQAHRRRPLQRKPVLKVRNTLAKYNAGSERCAEDPHYVRGTAGPSQRRGFPGSDCDILVLSTSPAASAAVKSSTEFVHGGKDPLGGREAMTLIITVIQYVLVYKSHPAATC